MALPIRYTLPPSAPSPQAPPAARILVELGGIKDFIRLGARGFRPRPDGDPAGETAILIPGWQASEATMAPVRRYLRSLGVDARHWGLGTNRGNPERDAEQLRQNLEHVVADLGGPVSLLGWSLGGVLARELAKLKPDCVRQVISLGSPITDDRNHTNAARLFKLFWSVVHASPCPVGVCSRLITFSWISLGRSRTCDHVASAVTSLAIPPRSRTLQKEISIH